MLRRRRGVGGAGAAGGLLGKLDTQRGVGDTQEAQQVSPGPLPSS